MSSNQESVDGPESIEGPQPADQQEPAPQQGPANEPPVGDDSSSQEALLVNRTDTVADEQEEQDDPIPVHRQATGIRTEEEIWWSRSRLIMFTCLIILFLSAIVGPMFVADLNRFSIFDIPFGYYIGAQGSVLVFVVLVLWFAAKQHRLDQEHGFDEDH